LATRELSEFQEDLVFILAERIRGAKKKGEAESFVERNAALERPLRGFA
jgi:hypothetical protein